MLACRRLVTAFAGNTIAVLEDEDSTSVPEADVDEQ
jgi:hypothetical protein